jgi:hypothetical protein
MRALIVAACLLGCGRFHFGEEATDTDADSGQSADACASDDAPCDDLNICTTSSTCRAGTCVATEPAGPCTVADSVADFATVQGERGWYYGYWFASNDTDDTYQPSTDFLQLAYNAGTGGWRPPDYEASGPNFTWAYLQWWGGHPGAIPAHKLPVRRWVSPVSGRAEVELHHAKSDASGGDGTRAILIVDGVTMLSRDVAGTDGVGFVEFVPIELSIGSTVDLMIHYIGSESVDTTNSSLIVRSR